MYELLQLAAEVEGARRHAPSHEDDDEILHGIERSATATRDRGVTATIGLHVMYGPLIQGSHFKLRPPRMEEAEVMIAWFEDIEVTARLSRTFPPSLEGEREWLKQMAEDQHQILWVIEHEGRPVGTTGIHQIDWANQHGVTGTLIGDKTAWGRGIAGEMMRLRADFAFTHLPLRKLKSGYFEGNEASRRAQAGAGYREVGRLRQEVFRDGRWLDMIMTELLREDWEQARGRGPTQRSGPTGTPT